jgi:hypothetical protein
MVVLLSHGRDQGEKALCERGEFAYCHRHNARCQAGALCSEKKSALIYVRTERRFTLTLGAPPKAKGLAAAKKSETVGNSLCDNEQRNLVAGHAVG